MNTLLLEWCSFVICTVCHPCSISWIIRYVCQDTASVGINKGWSVLKLYPVYKVTEIEINNNDWRVSYILYAFHRILKVHKRWSWGLLIVYLREIVPDESFLGLHFNDILMYFHLTEVKFERRVLRGWKSIRLGWFLLGTYFLACTP
jgi:hypothetical protein